MASDEPTATPAPAGDGGEEQLQGVFGNLPRERPGARSPRRDESAPTRGAAARPRPASASAGSGTEPKSTREHTAGKVPDPTGDSAGGIEDVAWAGVAAAAEAATIGVRLATRALEAMRDAVDRR